MRTPKILYFIADSLPTEEDYEDVAEMGIPVAFRNAAHIVPTDSPEKCDGVAGLVPESYKKLPTVGEALKAWRKEVMKNNKVAEAVAGGKPPKTEKQAEKPAETNPEQKAPPATTGGTEKKEWGG